jgi:glycosyltransferase involved in cell wall biosynthesis
MKILVNASTTVVGGGVQVATAFISWALRDPQGCNFVFAVSPQVMQNLEVSRHLDKRFHLITPSPPKLWSGRHSRHQLRALEANFQPDLVFTVFGPAYVRFTSTHLCGFADAWVTHRSPIAMKALPLFGRLRTTALCFYKQARLSPLDYYWVETEVARRALVRLLGIDPSRLRVILNTYAAVFDQARGGQVKTANDEIIRVFSLAAPYPHKNLAIIPEVARLLHSNTRKIRYKFIVTLPNDGHEVDKFWAKVERYGVGAMIENVGLLKLSECQSWYAKCSIVFLPTLLETFSATYPEAMVMERPIVTTDLDFAHEICGDAAAYFTPLSARAAADAIEKVATDEAFRESLIENGRKRLSFFPRPDEKYRMMMQWIYEVIERSHRQKSCNRLV